MWVYGRFYLFSKQTSVRRSPLSLITPHSCFYTALSAPTLAFISPMINNISCWGTFETAFSKLAMFRVEACSFQPVTESFETMWATPRLCWLSSSDCKITDPSLITRRPHPVHRHSLIPRMSYFELRFLIYYVLHAVCLEADHSELFQKPAERASKVKALLCTTASMTFITSPPCLLPIIGTSQNKFEFIVKHMTPSLVMTNTSIVSFI